MPVYLVLYTVVTNIVNFEIEPYQNRTIHGMYAIGDITSAPNVTLGAGIGDRSIYLIINESNLTIYD